MISRIFAAAAFSLAALAAFGQQEGAAQATVEVMESSQYGAHLTDGEGRALYLFINEQAAGALSRDRTEGVREAAAPCGGRCLEAWPPLEAANARAGEGVNADLLYTAPVNGSSQVIYNGWPLYYFARDTGAGQAQGQGMGRDPNIWYLVDPQGRPIETQGEG